MRADTQRHYRSKRQVREMRERLMRDVVVAERPTKALASELRISCEYVSKLLNTVGCRRLWLTPEEQKQIRDARKAARLNTGGRN